MVTLNRVARTRANDAPTQFLSVDGVQYAYRRFGEPSETSLVLCQRFRGTMDDWDPAFLDALAARRRVVIFDNAGVGRSSGETAGRIPGMAATAAAFIGALGEGPVDVLGWSMGGAVAQALTLTTPGIVRRLIVAGSGPGDVPDRAPMPQRVIETVARPVNTDEDFLFLFFDGSAERRDAGRQHLLRLGHRAEGPSPLTKRESVMAMLQALRTWATEDGVYTRLNEIRQPVLVANGMHDVMIPASHSFAMMTRLRNAELVMYSDAGHAFLFQHADEFAGQVLRFLS